MKWFTATRAMIVLVVLVLIMGAANLEATRTYVGSYKTSQARLQAAQGRAGAAVEAKICTDVVTMSALKPPTGAASSNPSRAYEQAEHRAWRGLVVAIGCKAGATP